MAVQVKDIPLDKITTLNSPNPNSMSEDRYKALLRSIGEYGFLQPILVKKEGSSYVLIDGAHRMKAMLDLGKDKITAVIADTEEAAAKLLRISLNKLRGEMDHTILAEEINSLMEDFSHDQLLATGLSMLELEAMEGIFNSSEEELFSGSDTTLGRDEEKVKTHNLTLKFDNEIDRAKFKEFLLERGDTLEEGALNLV